MDRDTLDEITGRLIRHIDRRGGKIPRSYCISRDLYLRGVMEMAERRLFEGKPFLMSMAIDRPNFLLMNIPIIIR